MPISSQEIIYINLIHYPLYVLGPKKRVGIWFDGCSFGCEGCISKHTWEQKEQNRDIVSKIVDKVCKFNSSRVTITGGEPFEQPKALLVLLKELRSRGVDDILVYSGYKFSYLRDNFGDIIELIDVVIDGRFDKNQESIEIYRGSSNQKMYILNNNLKSIYEAYKNSTKRELQILDKNNQFYILGIPKIDFIRSNL